MRGREVTIWTQKGHEAEFTELPEHSEVLELVSLTPLAESSGVVH